MNNRKSALVLFLASQLAGPALANEEVDRLSRDARNWVMQSGNYHNHRHSALKQINKDNAKALRPVWSISTGVLRGHEGGPLVVGDTLYVHTPFPNKVVAIDLETQRIKWKYEPKQIDNMAYLMGFDTVNRGLAYGQGMIFLQQADTTLVALNASNGRELWKVRNGNPKVGATNTNAPHVFKDKVITGIDGGSFGVRGYIAAYNIQDGKLAWRGYSTGPDADMLVDPYQTMTWSNGRMASVGRRSSLDSWQGDQWRIGGGTTQGWYAFDPALNLMYHGTGNPSTWNASQRPGDNRWANAIWARDVDTGRVAWVYQMTPHDEWSFEGVNEMILADITVKGQKVPALVHFDRNGFAYTLNRKTGDLLVAEKFDPKTNWATHVDVRSGRPKVNPDYATSSHTSSERGPDINAKGICPAAIGAKGPAPAAFNPMNGKFYVPTTNLCMDYEPFRVEHTEGQPYVGATLNMFPADKNRGNLGGFLVWNATTGKIEQSKPEKMGVISGVLTTEGGIACYGTLDGYLKCVDANDISKELYRFKTPSGIIGNVNTWEYKGRQYIGVLSGIGGWAGIGLAAGLERDTDGLGAVGAFKDLAKHTDLGGVLTVFALP